MKLIAICGLILLCGGCADHPDGWEFQVYKPIGTNVEQLLETEKVLRASGYKRVRIVVIDYGRAILISATKKEGGDK